MVAWILYWFLGGKPATKGGNCQNVAAVFPLSESVSAALGRVCCILKKSEGNCCLTAIVSFWFARPVSVH
jgi:hypothetical protein